MRRELAVCGLLALAVAGVFGQTLRHEFVDYDDPTYISENPPVCGGLTASGVVWAFTARHAGNWHPLTWLSHATDCQIYGQAAWGHHLTNVLLHAATAILLFLVLRRMTGDFWPAAFVAAAFALHPLRVESVAWAAERKDVLSGLFFMLALAAYLGYVRRPFSWMRYSIVVMTFALGLMAKPMLVTLPFVLLLLDYWPLRRFDRQPESGASETRRQGDKETGRQGHNLPLIPRPSPLAPCPVVEKIPLFLVAAASCGITLWAQSEAIAYSQPVALGWRIGNAAVSYAAYLVQSFVPVNLAVLYPHPGDSLPAWEIVAAAALLAAICAVVGVLWRKMPFLAVGWLWFLGMLLPTIGLIQVGHQARADRYSYLPQIGLWIAVAWTAARAAAFGTSREDYPEMWHSRPRLCETGRHSRGRLCYMPVLGPATRTIFAAVALAVMAVCAWRQTSYWRDSETLWTHTIRCTGRNPIAHYNFGVALAAERRIDEAMSEYRRAVDEKPDYPEARYNLGVLLAARGEIDEAILQYKEALRAEPKFSDAHCNLGAALAGRGLLDEAIEHYRAALNISRDADVYNNLGNAELRLGRVAEAISHYKEALRLMPNYADAHGNLGTALLQCGRLDEAIVHYRKVLALQPGNENARRNLEAAIGGLQKAERGK